MVVTKAAEAPGKRSSSIALENLKFSQVLVDLSSVIMRLSSTPWDTRYRFMASASLIFSPSPLPPDTITAVFGLCSRYSSAVSSLSLRVRDTRSPRTAQPSTMSTSLP